MTYTWRIHTNYGTWHCQGTESQIKAKHDEYVRKWLEMIECEKKDGRSKEFCHQPCEVQFSYTRVQAVLLGALKLPSYQPMPVKS